MVWGHLLDYGRLAWKEDHLELASHLTNKILYCLNLISSGVLDISRAMEMEMKFYGVCDVPSLGL